MALTEQKKRFADLYFDTLKGSQSAIEAGYSADTARQIAHNLLQEPEVEEYLQKLRDEAAIKHGITKDKWLSELAAIGFSNIRDFMSAGNTFRDIADISRDTTRVVASVKKTVTEFEGGEKVLTEFKLHDKLAALEKIGRHFGYYEKDNEQRVTIMPILNLDPLSHVDNDDRTQENISTSETD